MGSHGRAAGCLGFRFEAEAVVQLVPEDSAPFAKLAARFQGQFLLVPKGS